MVCRRQTQSRETHSNNEVKDQVRICCNIYILHQRVLQIHLKPAMAVGNC
uniref:Uncharacterized protein n=1 Tax=Anguilla anguilla TaxID=7936 RepID=A0A0E9X219_ANGAN